MKRNGFTLIELMVVIAIIGIGAAIVLPAYQNWARGGRQEVAPAQNGRVVERHVSEINQVSRELSKDTLVCNGGFLTKSDGQVITQNGIAVKC